MVFVSCSQKPIMYKTTPKGYLRFAKDEDGRLRFEHSIVWEQHNGKIPLGMQIHHIDHDKTNNSIENLQLVTPLEHKRLHSGCRLVNDVWEKPCKTCNEYKPCNKENWYFARGVITGKICKKCFIQKSLSVRKVLIENGWKRKNYKKVTQTSLL